MSRECQDIKVKQINALRTNAYEYTHPAFGVLSLCRGWGNGVLFGADTDHRDRIILTLKKGRGKHVFGGDYYSGNEVIAQIEMSYSQFIEAITSMGMVDGVPCTLLYTEKDGSIPAISKK